MKETLIFVLFEFALQTRLLLFNQLSSICDDKASDRSRSSPEWDMSFSRLWVRSLARWESCRPTAVAVSGSTRSERPEHGSVGCSPSVGSGSGVRWVGFGLWVLLSNEGLGLSLRP